MGRRRVGPQAIREYVGWMRERDEQVWRAFSFHSRIGLVPVGVLQVFQARLVKSGWEAQHMKNNAFVSLAIIFGLLLAAAPVMTHHAFSAEFDANKTFKMTGTVTKLEWANPHAWFYIDVKDDSGMIINWGMEMASPNLLMRNGWTKASMKVGDVVTVDGFHAKNGSTIGNARTVTLTATGQSLLTGSSGGGR